jgi:hypothetical protein
MLETSEKEVQELELVGSLSVEVLELSVEPFEDFVVPNFVYLVERV